MDDKTWAVSSDAVHSEKRIIKSLLLSISKKILKIFMGCGMSDKPQNRENTTQNKPYANFKAT